MLMRHAPEQLIAELEVWRQVHVAENLPLLSALWANQPS
jgi:hypothetical protein